jgi:alkylated DNA repair dioxygenase AlkB
MVDHPRGLEYVADHEYLVEHRREILELLKTSVWTWFSKPGSRRVIHYNYRYDYKKYCVAPAGQDIPELLLPLAAALDAPAGSKLQCIVNEYEPGQFISKHTDAKCFGPKIACYSLADSEEPVPYTRCLLFRRGGTECPISVGDQSMYTMEGDARHAFTHESKPCRAKFYSLTFRTVL